ncbi:MAG: hypothetical protein MJ175_04830 [Clostridia bacterium]|nr:hypothetical protein [Clostridia bacterium]
MKKTFDPMAELFIYPCGAAVAALAVMIVLSVFLGTNLSLLSMQAEVTRAYENEIGLTLKKCAVAAEDLCDVAAACGVSGEKLEAVVDIVSHADNTPVVSQRDTEDLFRYTLSVYKSLAAAGNMTGAQEKTVLSSLGSVGEGLKILADSADYAQKAAKYNKAISYPLAGIIGIPDFKPAVTFDTIAATYQSSYEEVLVEASENHVIGSITDFLTPIIGALGNDHPHDYGAVWSVFGFMGAAGLLAGIISMIVTAVVVFVIVYVLCQILLAVLRPKKAYISNRNNPYRNGSQNLHGSGDKSNKNPYSSHINTKK